MHKQCTCFSFAKNAVALNTQVKCGLWTVTYGLDYCLWTGLWPMDWTVAYGLDWGLWTGLGPMDWTGAYGLDCGLWTGLWTGLYHCN